MYKVVMDANKTPEKSMKVDNVLIQRLQYAKW